MRIFDPKCKLVYYVDNKAYTIDSLHMEFDINLSLSSEPNTAEINVYNLSEATRNKFGHRFQKIEFYAGYDNDPKLIFIGNIVNVVSERDGVDWATHIWASDGIKEFTSIFFNKSYKKGTKISVIMEDMCKATGLPYVIDKFNLPDTLILSGESYCGKVKDVLQKLCDDYDHEFSIQHGVLEITVKGHFFTQEDTAVVISSYTGMIDSPSIEITTVQELVRPDIKKKKPEKKKKKKEVEEEKKETRHRITVNVKSVLNPDLKPNRLIYISTMKKGLYVNINSEFESKNIYKTVDDLYVIKSVNFLGDNFGGPFEADIKADLPIMDREMYDKISTRFEEN